MQESLNTPQLRGGAPEPRSETRSRTRFGELASHARPPVVAGCLALLVAGTGCSKVLGVDGSYELTAPDGGTDSGTAATDAGFNASAFVADDSGYFAVSQPDSATTSPAAGEDAALPTCSGTLDREGCACPAGSSPRSCYSGPASQAGIGVCNFGTQTCEAGDGGASAWGPCVGAGSPNTCAAAGAACGQIGDGCGGVVACGTCPTGMSCGGATPNVCGAGPCTPTTCATLGYSCGTAPDGCGGVLSCGACAAPEVCGAGVANQCGAPSCTFNGQQVPSGQSVTGFATSAVAWSSACPGTCEPGACTCTDGVLRGTCSPTCSVDVSSCVAFFSDPANTQGSPTSVAAATALCSAYDILFSLPGNPRLADPGGGAFWLGNLASVATSCWAYEISRGTGAGEVTCGDPAVGDCARYFEKYGEYPPSSECPSPQGTPSSIPTASCP